MKRYTPYTVREIKPLGWMKRQLEIQADGLAGNLDKMWPSVRDSQYIGGTDDGWERVPYWLDGFIPLAFLLEDEDKIARAKRYIDAILSFQRPDGWMCPCEEGKEDEYDTWAVLLLSKVLTLYYECTREERVLGSLYRMMKNYYEWLKSGKIHLFSWGKYRWFEGFFALRLLKNVYKESWIEDLATILHEQGEDYSRDMKKWEHPLWEWQWDTHIVNLAMMLKGEALWHAFCDEEDLGEGETFYQCLSRYNGTAVGFFTGDECLAGLSPIHGTELCGVVEAMFSFEMLYALTGENQWAERLEMLGFNALPATVSDDMWTHQYDQMSNQIACVRFPGKPPFSTNGVEAHLFGLEPHYGCCTANFGQGFPKFALSAFMHRDNTIQNVVLLPSVLDEKRATVRLETDYPFENKAVFTVEAREDFHFSVRLPSFAERVQLNGVCVDEVEVDFAKGDKKRLEISFDTSVEVVSRPHHLVSVKKGSLLFALPLTCEKTMLEYERDGVERKFPYCDYELRSNDKWNFALASQRFETVFKGVSTTPFSSQCPPLILKAKMKEIEWEFEQGYRTVCAVTPKENAQTGATEEKVLYPYGCAKLRMTEIPLREE